MTLADLRSVPPPPTTAGATLFGREEPRLWTRPLRPLTRSTTLGYQAIEFAETVLGVSLLPWQRWWLLHALELKATGGFRFRTIVTLVSRQNGKTFLLKILSLWFLYLGHGRLVLGAAQSLDIARESWTGAVEMAQGQVELASEVANVRYANGEQCLTLANGARYRIAAATRSAGRGLSVDLLVLDELREQRTTEAWAALSKTTMARPNALTVCISNAGDDQSVVLNSLRSAALADADPGLGIFEWSAPDGCELDDPLAWAQACPGLNHGTITEAAIRTALATDPPAVFRTELLCQHVSSLDGAIDPVAWSACADREGTVALGQLARVALCLDVSPDYQHVTLMGAGVLPDGRVRLGLVGAWTDIESARSALPDLLAAIRPAEFGWFPSGPAAAMGSDLRRLRLRFRRTIAKIVQPDGEPRKVITEDEEEFARLTSGLEREACQGFAANVIALRILQPDDRLLNAHVGGAVKLRTGDGWRFGRVGGVGHVDAAYAAAGADYLARLLPEPTPVPRSAVF